MPAAGFHGVSQHGIFYIKKPRSGKSKNFFGFPIVSQYFYPIA